MGKFGKILAPVVAVFAIAAAVMSFLVAKQGKLFRQRAEILAGGLSSAAAALDSGSGEMKNATFTKGENDGPEDGTLGWPSFANDGSAYEQSANSVAALAKKVNAQRDAIIQMLVEVSERLDVPEDARPVEEKLKDLPSYADNGSNGLDAFNEAIDDRLGRDDNLINEINALRANLGVEDEFNGTIQRGGELTNEDQKVFQNMAVRVSNLQKNHKAYQEVVAAMLTGLTQITIEDEEGTRPQWRSNPRNPLFREGGMEGVSKAKLNVVAENFREDLGFIKAQLARIPVLQGEIRQLQEELETQKKEYAKLKAKFDADEAVIENYYRQGAGMLVPTEGRVPKASIEEVLRSGDVFGEILQLDAKYGYIIISLTKYEIVDGLKLSVHRRSNGDYLGVIQVISANDFNSIAMVASGDIRKFSVGDVLVVGGKAINIQNNN
ncbi:MAG: hypothetical protein IKS83_01220 [Victivallales bacterium]|nr:hypothetical protein [Victivallales bacterium]